MATPADAYDTMKLSELIDECAERGLEAGALKGNALRELLRRDDAAFGLGRAPLPVPQPVATGLPPMAAAVAAAASVRRAWGDSADSIAATARIKAADAAEREAAMAEVADVQRSPSAASRRRPATAMERSTLALQRHVQASAASAEATPQLKHPPWIEEARADRSRQLAAERQAEAAPKAWSRGARADDELNDVPTQAELSALPVPLNPTRVRIMMGQDVDIVLRNPNAQLPAPAAAKDAAAKGRSATAGNAQAQAVAADAAGAQAGAGLDAAASTVSALPSFLATAPAPAEAGAGFTAAAAGSSVAAMAALNSQRPGSAASQSLRSGSARPGSALLRPGSAQGGSGAAGQGQAPLARLPEYNVEQAAAAATAGLRAEEVAAVKAANAARGIGDYTAGFDAAAFAGSFTLVSAAQRKAARRAGLLTPAQGTLRSGAGGGGGGGGGAHGARSLASRPSSARPSSASAALAASAAAAAAAQQQLAAPAATDRLGRPGSALAGASGEAGEYLVNAPRHVRYVADLRRQVAEVGSEVRTAREDLLARIATLLDPHWRPPPAAATKAGAAGAGAAGAAAVADGQR